MMNSYPPAHCSWRASNGPPYMTYSDQKYFEGGGGGGGRGWVGFRVTDWVKVGSKMDSTSALHC